MSSLELFDIGQRIKDLRETNDWTQEDLVEELKKYDDSALRSTLAKWETGRQDFKTKQIIAFSKIFGVSTDYLLGISKVQSIDTDVKAICNMLHLSEDAADNLLELAEVRDEHKSDTVNMELQIISKFLERNDFYAFIHRVRGFCDLNPSGTVFERMDVDYEKYTAINEIMKIINEIQEELNG